MTTNYISLPLFDDAFYSYSIALEGNSYVLEFKFNERMNLYVFNLYDAENNPLILGEVLVPTYPIFLDYVIPNLTGWFYLQENAAITGEPYKDFPQMLSQYYSFFYSYVTED